MNSLSHKLSIEITVRDTMEFKGPILKKELLKGSLKDLFGGSGYFNGGICEWSRRYDSPT